MTTEQRKPIFVTDASGMVVVAVHQVNARTLARVLESHPNHVPLIRAAFSQQAPDVLAEHDAN